MASSREEVQVPSASNTDVEVRHTADDEQWIEFAFFVPLLVLASLCSETSACSYCRSMHQNVFLFHAYLVVLPTKCSATETNSENESMTKVEDWMKNSKSPFLSLMGEFASTGKKLFFS